MKWRRLIFLTHVLRLLIWCEWRMLQCRVSAAGTRKFDPRLDQMGGDLFLCSRELARQMIRDSR